MEPNSTQHETISAISQPDREISCPGNVSCPRLLQQLPSSIWEDISLQFRPDDIQALILTCKAIRHFVVATSITRLFINQFSMARLQPSQVALHSDLVAFKSLVINLKGPLMPHTLPFLQSLQHSSSSLLSGVTSLKLLLNHRLPAPLVSSLHHLLASCYNLARLELCVTMKQMQSELSSATMTLVLHENSAGAGLSGISNALVPGSEMRILNTRRATFMNTPWLCRLLAHRTIRSYLKSLHFGSSSDNSSGQGLPEKTFAALNRSGLLSLQSLSLYPCPTSLPLSLPHLTHLTLLCAAFTSKPPAKGVLDHVPQLEKLKELKLGFMLFGVQEGIQTLKVPATWSTLQSLTKLSLDYITLPVTCGVWKLRCLRELLLDMCVIEVPQLGTPDGYIPPTPTPPEITSSSANSKVASTSASTPPIPSTTFGLHSLSALQNLHLNDSSFTLRLSPPQDFVASYLPPALIPPAPRFPPCLASLSISCSLCCQAPIPPNILSHATSLSHLKRLLISETCLATGEMSSHEKGIRNVSQWEILNATARIESLEQLEVSFVLLGHPAIVHTMPLPNFDRLSHLTSLSFTPHMYQSDIEFPSTVHNLQQLTLSNWQAYLPPTILGPRLTSLQVAGDCLTGYRQSAPALKACTALEVLHLNVEGIWFDFNWSDQHIAERIPGIKSVLPDLTSLRCLKLSSLPCWLRDTPPPLHGLSLSRLVRLTSLFLSSENYCYQQAASLDLHFLPRLKNLYLHLNLADPPPSLPCSLTCLHITLRSHPTTIPNSIVSCTALEQLVVEATHGSGLRGTSALAALSNLNRLVLTGVQDESISELDSLSMLTELRVHSAPYHKVVGQLTNLQKSLAPECLSLAAVQLIGGGRGSSAAGTTVGRCTRGCWFSLGQQAGAWRRWASQLLQQASKG